MGRFAGLDGLRGIAALIVVLFHLEIDFHGGSLWTAGYLAVDLFFILSGFVITRVYEPRFAAGLSPAGFMSARLRRFWPAYAIGCTLGLTHLLFIRIDGAVPTYFLALLFLPSPFVAGHAFAINGPGWSLTFELVANLFHVMVFAAASTRKLLLWTVIFLIGLIALLIHNDGNLLPQGMEGLPASFFRTMAAYLLGILLGRFASTPQISPWWSIAALAPIILALAFVPPITRALLFTLLIAPLMIWSSLKSPVWPSLAAGLGAISYPLYALHDPILTWGYDLGWSRGQSLGAALLSACLLAAVLEKKIWRRGRGRGRAVAAGT